MFKIWVLDVVNKYQGTFVLDAFIDNSLFCKLGLIYGFTILGLDKDDTTYVGELS